MKGLEWKDQNERTRMEGLEWKRTEWKDQKKVQKGRIRKEGLE